MPSSLHIAVWFPVWFFASTLSVELRLKKASLFQYVFHRIKGKISAITFWNYFFLERWWAGYCGLNPGVMNVRKCFSAEIDSWLFIMTFTKEVPYPPSTVVWFSLYGK